MIRLDLRASTRFLLVIVVEHRHASTLVFFETAESQIAGETTAVGDQTQPNQIQISDLLANLFHFKHGAMAYSLDPDRLDQCRCSSGTGRTTLSSTSCSSTSTRKPSAGRAVGLSPQHDSGYGGSWFIGAAFGSLLFSLGSSGALLQATDTWNKLEHHFNKALRELNKIDDDKFQM